MAAPADAVAKAKAPAVGGWGLAIHLLDGGGTLRLQSASQTARHMWVRELRSSPFHDAILAPLALAAAALILVGCVGGGSGGLRTVARDELSTALDPTYRLIVATEESDLDQLRGLLQGQPFELAHVDFSKEVVVAMAGRMPNRGNPIIKKVTIEGGEVSVLLGGKGGSAFAGLSQNSTPFHAVAVRREAVPHPDELRWVAYFDGQQLAGTARFGGRWLPNFKVKPGLGTIYRTVAGGHLEESPPAHTTLLVARESGGLEAFRRIGGRAAESWPLDRVDFSTNILVGVFQGTSGPAYGDHVYVEDVSSIARYGPSLLARWDDRGWEQSMVRETLEGKLDRTWAASYQIVAVPRSLLADGSAELGWVLLGPRGGVFEGLAQQP